jgi:glucose/arabinose dehydrogenase
MHQYRNRDNLPLVLLIGLLLLAACSTTTNPTDTTDSSEPGSPAVSNLTLPAGFRATVYATGLRGPTAMNFGPEGALFVTQLNGPENAGTGQVVRVDAPGAEPIPVLEDLLKPTGLAWRDDALFVVLQRDVIRVRREADGQLGEPEMIVRDLPFNSRSTGQITLLPDDRLLFESSGTLSNPDSGKLLTLAPGEETPQELARGFKNAYAHAVDPATGQIYTTEIGDGLMDGEPPPEEINLVQPGAHYGWPRCYADREPAANNGGTEEFCATTVPPVITFPPRTTPTGLTFYAGEDFPPDYRDALYVALWQGDPPRVWRVTLAQEDERVTGAATPFIDGMERPMDLLPHPDGGLLALDFGAGVVYRVERRGGN